MQNEKIKCFRIAEILQSPLTELSQCHETLLEKAG